MAQLQFTQETFLTYREMDSWANGLAHILLANCIKRGDLIGLYLDKSLETFISILATQQGWWRVRPSGPRKSGQPHPDHPWFSGEQGCAHEQASSTSTE
jgi:non-ribosomal peptide synthetase component F